MRLTEEAQIFWRELTGGQKLLLILAGLLIAITLASGWIGWVRTSFEVRRHERDATVAKREAEDALKLAAKIAKDKLELERTLTQIEAKRDEKNKQLNQAHLETLDARSDYERALREQRGDDPSTDELCAELAALGYACR